MLKTSFSKDEKSITPLTVFLMDDMLYSHDHKRIVANIAAGNRYMLGVLNQNAYVIVQREIGYRPMKCVFSQNDKSLILKFTDKQLKEFGHYFFLVGDDMTPFMETVFNTSVEERFNDLKKSRSRLLNNEYSTNPKGVLRLLHNTCSPTLFQFLDRNDYLKSWYQNKIRETVDYLDNIKLKIFNLKSVTEESAKKKYNFKKNNFKENNYYKMYLKYKNKYLALKSYKTNLVGGLTEEEIEIYATKYFKADINRRSKNEEVSSSARLEANRIKEEINKMDIDIKIKIFAKFRQLKENYIKQLKNKLNMKKKPPKIKRSSIKILYKLTDNNISKNNIITIFINNTIRKDISSDHLIIIIEKFIEYYLEQLNYLSYPRSNKEMLSWELNNIGNSFWYIFYVDSIHDSIKNLIDIKYPFIKRTIYPTKTPPFCVKQFSIKKNFKKGAIRYSKTPHPELEDLVMLFRTGLNQINNSTPKGYLKQIYNIYEILEWQTNEFSDESKSSDTKSSFPYLNPSNLMELYPETDGILNDRLMTILIEKQEYDHKRIFRINTDSGPSYGAYQGLPEEVRYEKLRPVSEDMMFSIHLTKRDILNNILAGKELSGNTKNPSPLTGHLDLMGRYIHAFGWVEGNIYGGYRLIPDIWEPFKNRLYCRFKDRVGVVINMSILRDFYLEKGIEWESVCGINDINTVIFLKPVPPIALIARNRVVSDEIIKPGIAYEMDEMWGIYIR